MSGLNVGVLGATGAVGREIISLLLKRKFPCKKILLMASERSEGRKIEIDDNEFIVRAVRPEYFKELDLVLFSPGSKVSSYFAPLAVKEGAVVIDNSSAFRMIDDVPLVVPEINPEELENHRGIIANPNCSTIQMVLALNPIRKNYGLKRIVVTTFQSVSGSGQKGIEELKNQVEEFQEGRKDPSPSIYPHPIAFNLIPQIGDFLENGYCEEEIKMVNETRKIYSLPELAVHAVTVRVPVFYCHSESVYFETEKVIKNEELEEIFNQNGIRYYGKPEKYPVPLNTVKDVNVHVGRFKKDLTRENAYSLWVVADNLWKGAALNAVQIAEELLQRGLI